MEWEKTVFNVAEVLGIIAFALSGAGVAIDRGLDLVGVLFLGATTALGGGILRDMLLGQFPPVMFYSFEYVLIALTTSLLLFLIVRCARERYMRHKEQMLRIVNVFDAVGLGAFTVVGVQTGINAGYGDNVFMVLFLGMLTGIGGGMLRDILSHATPAVLYKHVYALASLAGGGLFYLLFYLHIPNGIAGGSAMAVTVLIRVLAAHFRWSLPKALSVEK